MTKNGNVFIKLEEDGTYTINGTSLTIEGIRRLADLCINLAYRLEKEFGGDK